MSNNKIIPYYLCSRLMFVVFCMQFAVSLVVKKYGDVFEIGLPLDYIYILLTQIVAVAIPCFLLCAIKKAGFKSTFRVRTFKMTDAKKCFALGFFLQPVAIIANIPLQILATNSNSVVAPPQNISDILLMTLFLCVIPSIFEELLLRGMVLTSLRKKGYAFSILVSTVLFVLLHGDIYTIMGHIILGVATAFAVLNTNSVLSGMLVHFSFNFCGVVIDYFTNNFYLLGDFVGTLGFFIALAVVGAVFSVFLMYRLNNKQCKKYPSDDFGYNLCKAFLNIPICIVVILYVMHNLI